MTEEIQKRYQRIPNKLEFIKELAEELNKKPRSIQANWFSGFKIIPEKYQERVLTKLNEKLCQKKK